MAVYQPIRDHYFLVRSVPADKSDTANGDKLLLEALKNTSNLQLMLVTHYKDRLTPLNYAAKNGLASAVKDIITRVRHAGIPAKNVLLVKSNRGWTPLHHAADSGHDAVVKILLECAKSNGIPLTDVLLAETKHGNIPLHFATDRGHGHDAVVKILLEWFGRFLLINKTLVNETMKKKNNILARRGH